MTEKGLIVRLSSHKLLRRLSTLLLTVALASPALAQQRTFKYVYDDLGQISKVIDQNTGECIVYSYDEVGNNTAIERRTNCLAAPTFGGITQGSTPNCFTVTGQDLLGAAVTTNIQGVIVTDVMAEDNQVSFCLSATEQFCSRTGTATVTTATGSFQTPVSTTGTTLLTPDVVASDAISTLGEKDGYCFDLAAQTRVVLQAVRPSGNLNPCLEVFSGTPATPVAGGTACADDFLNGGAVRLNLTLAAGTYFVQVSDTGTNDTGPYDLLLEVITGGTALIAGTPTPDTITPAQDFDLFTFALAATAQVTVQVTPNAGGIQPCLELFTGSPAQPVTGGSVCTNGTAQRNLQLGAGDYFVLVSDNGNNNTGGYSVLLQVQ